MVMKILLCDRNPDLVLEWQGRMPEAEAFCGDIFERPAYAVVSPANSFGFMDGGIDLAYSHRFGWGIQEAVQRRIRDDFHGELLVGQALSVETGDCDFPVLISAPTMRVPVVISDPNQVRLATRAAFVEAMRIGARSVLFPGMGTGCGRVKPDWAASMMAAGIKDASNPGFPASLKEASQAHFAPFVGRQ